MATFLLSISAHVVFSHAPLLRTVTRLKVESSLPIRLTQSGPLAANTQCRLFSKKRPVLGYWKFESWGIPEGHFPPIIISTGRSWIRCCYPERNFERNQLLGGSMSLSPLYATPTKDLHVTTVAGLHQPFDWLRPRRVKITTFRVYIRRLCTCGLASLPTLTWLSISAFAAPSHFHAAARSLT